MRTPSFAYRSQTVLLATLLLAACASTPSPLKDAESLVAAGQFEEGLRALEAMAKQSAQSHETRAALLRAQALASDRLIRSGRSAAEAGRFDDAEAAYRRLITLTPGHTLAQAEVERVGHMRQRERRVLAAEGLIRGGQLREAERGLKEVLAEDPQHRKAGALLKQIDERTQRRSAQIPALAPEFQKVISLEFRDVNLKSVFDALWHSSGINFVLDRDVRSDTKVTLFVREISVNEAIDAVLAMHQLARKSVNAKTLLIYPKTPQKIAEHQELTIRNFFLSHADPKVISAMLKTILKIRDVHIDEKRNLVVVRDSAEAVALAEKLIQAHDQAEPEVMLAIDVIEIKRSRLRDFGLSFPNQVALGIGNPITVQGLGNLNSSRINVGLGGLSAATGPGVLATLNIAHNDGNTNMLANPRIRVRNREKAKVHIGDRLPVVTTTSSAINSFVGQTVNYLDVGLKLEVEPQVMLDGEVAIKLNLEVSSATASKVNSGFFDVGTRNVTTMLTIRDGEMQVLAGLIRDDERGAISRLPGIGNVPLLGRLFSSERSEQDKTEIILAITPHVLQNLVRPSADLIEYTSGTESGRAAVASASPGAPGQSSSSPSPSQGQAPGQTPGVSPPMGRPPVANPGAPLQPMPTPVLPGTPAPGGVPSIDFEPPPGVGMTRPPAQPPVPAPTQ